MPIPSPFSCPVVVSVQSHTDEGPSSSSQKIERNGVSPPTSRVLSTEPIDESIASRNVPAQSTPPPPRDRLPPPKPAPFLLSEDAGDAGYDPQVEYQNVTSDMLNVGEVQLYQNVVHPESEYKNCQFVPPKKPTGHLGTYIATSSAEQTMEECIRVRTHDRGELLAESKEWWYMRIGKEEGWTPKEIWEPTVSGQSNSVIVCMYVRTLTNLCQSHWKGEGGRGEREEGREREGERRRKGEGGKGRLIGTEIGK